MPTPSISRLDGSGTCVPLGDDPAEGGEPPDELVRPVEALEVLVGDELMLLDELQPELPQPELAQPDEPASLTVPRLSEYQADSAGAVVEKTIITALVRNANFVKFIARLHSPAK